MQYVINRDGIHWSQRPCPEAEWRLMSNGDHRWVIRIDSLEDLQAFTAKYGHVLVGECSAGPYIEMSDFSHPEWDGERTAEQEALIALDEVCIPRADPATML